MSLTLDDWITDPESVIDAIFAPGGPLSAVMPHYVRNEQQVDYAKLLAKAATRGSVAGNEGVIAAIEAGTGIGKSVAILIVAGVTALLRRRRALVTTYTRILNRQIAGKDGDVAAAVVAQVIGEPLKIAVRRPRSAFASPKSCRRHAKALQSEACYAVGDDARDKLATAEALIALADWTDNALERARLVGQDQDRLAFTRSFDGLIETFLATNDIYKVALSQMPYDLFTFDANAGDDEQVAWRLFDDEAKGAHVMVATHASLIRDQSRFGSILDPDGLGFSFVVADEANRLEEAGRLALGTKRALSSFGRDIEAIQPIAASKAAHAVRQELTAASFLQREAAERMLISLAALSERARARNDREVEVRGDEPWISELQALADGSAKILGLLKKVNTSEAKAVADRLRVRQADVETFFDCLRREKANRERLPGIDLPPSERSYAKASVSFTPYVGEPSILVKPKRGARVLSRMWAGNDGPKLDAFVATSATLGMPGRRGSSSFESLLKSIGVDRSSPRLAHDLCQTIEMKKFGSMRRLVLADPQAPLPSQKDEQAHLEGTHRNPAWANYVADAVIDALNETWREDDRSHVVVLCTSFDEAEALGELAGRHFNTDTIHVRTRDRSINEGFDWLAETVKGALFTVGAFDGVDRPRQIDHLFIPRVPFPRQSGKFYRAFIGSDGMMRDAPMIEEATMMLRQGIGRAFRSPDDEAVVWILDPRIGLPASSIEVAHERSNPSFLSAVPVRFAKEVRGAQIRRFSPKGGT